MGYISNGRTSKPLSLTIEIRVVCSTSMTRVMINVCLSENFKCA